MKPGSLQRIGNCIRRVESIYLVILMASLVVLSFIQIAGRLLLNQGFFWADPIINHLVMWSALAGAVAATRSNEHINIDIFQRLLSRRDRALVQAGMFLVSVLICVILIHASIRFIIDEYHMGPVIVAPVRSWILQLPIPLSFLFIGLRFLMLAVDRIIGIGKEP